MSGLDGSEPGGPPFTAPQERCADCRVTEGWAPCPHKPRPVGAARGDRLAFLLSSRPKLVDYLKMKLEAEDWHGVQDAASDLRDLDSELDGLRY